MTTTTTPYRGGWDEGRITAADRVRVRAAADAALDRRAAMLGLDPDAFRALLDDDLDDLDETLARYGLTRDDLARKVDAIDDDGSTYLDHDDLLDRIDPEPFDPTWTRPRITTANGIEVRGMRRGYVVGSRDDDDDRPHYARVVGRILDPSSDLATRLDYRSCQTIADAFLAADGSLDRLRLIGTDIYSWHHVVAHKPDSVTTTTGDRYVARPEGAGRSIVGTSRPSGRVPTDRPTVPSFVLRVPTTDGTAESWRVVGRPVVEVLDDRLMVRGYRIRKVYGTTYRRRTIYGTTRTGGTGWVGKVVPSSFDPSRTPTAIKRYRDLVTYWHEHGITPNPYILDPSRTTTVRRRRKITTTILADLDAVLDAAGTAMLDAFRTSTTTTVRYGTTDGTTVTTTNDPDRRRVRVEVARIVDGTTVRRGTTIRKVDAVPSAARRLHGSIR